MNKNKPKSFRPVYWKIAVVIWGILLAAVAVYYLPGYLKTAQTTNWNEFESKMLARGAVEMVVITNNQKAGVYIRKEFRNEPAFREILQAPFGKDAIRPGPHYVFNIGSPEVFERKLEAAEVHVPVAKRVVVVYQAATNRADVLDPAPGRFDRHIYLELPSQAERNAIFRVHLKPKPLALAGNVDTQFLAAQTPGFSGADIANICNEAARIAARRKKEKVEKQDFVDAMDRIIAGVEKKSKKPYSEETARIIGREVRKLIEACYEQARNIQVQHKQQLILLAEELLEKRSDPAGRSVSSARQKGRKHAGGRAGSKITDTENDMNAKGKNFHDQHNEKMMILVAGLPGSGKSFFAERLAGRIGAEYLNSDQVRIDLHAMGKYTEADKLAVYRTMSARAAQALDAGKNVVADATFFHHTLRELFIQMAEEKKASIFVIEVIADEALIQKRLSKPRKRSEADYSVYENVRDAYEAITMPHLTLTSTNDNIEDMLTGATHYLRT